MPPDQRLSWWAYLGNYVEQGLAFILDLTQGWNGVVNRVPMLRFTSTTGYTAPRLVPVGNLKMVQCPAHPRQGTPNGPCETDFVGIAGLGVDAPGLPEGHPRAGVFGFDRRTRVDQIRDGAATTLLVVETSSNNGPWTAGGPATVRGLDPERTPYIGRGRQFGGLHRGGANVVFADGSVRFVRDDVNV